MSFYPVIRWLCKEKGTMGCVGQFTALPDTFIHPCTKEFLIDHRMLDICKVLEHN